MLIYQQVGSSFNLNFAGALGSCCSSCRSRRHRLQPVLARLAGDRSLR